MVDDGNDLEAISLAIKAAQAVKDQPSLIRVRTVIGYGSPKAGTNKAHGEALGPEATRETKKKLNWPEDKSFYVPEEAKQNWLQAVDKGKKYEQEWNDLFARYKKDFPDLAAEFERVQSGVLANGWEKSLPSFPVDKPIATRSAGGNIMDAIAKAVPELIGGAADLTSSTRTIFKDSANFHLDPSRPQYLFWCTRVWHVCGGQWYGRSRRIDSIRLDLLLLQRLLQTGASARGADAGALHLCIHS